MRSVISSVPVCMRERERESYKILLKVLIQNLVSIKKVDTRVKFIQTTQYYKLRNT